MPRPFLSGLRGRLLLLVALAALPAFALTFYAGWRDRQHQLAGVSVDTIRLARLVASDQERIIEGTRQILSDLAEVPEVREGDGVRSRRFFGLLMKQYRGYASFSLLDPAGNVIASLPAIEAPLNLSDRTWFRRAVTDKGFALGGYQIGQLTRKAVLVAAWPVLDEAGAVTRVITAALDIEWLNQIAATTQLPSGAMLVVLDRQDRIVARYPDAPHWVGRTVPEADVLSAVRSAPEGFVEAQGHDGEAHIYGFTPVRGRIETGLRLVVGIPRRQAYGAITRAQNRQILGLALVAVLTLAAAWFGAERFVLRRVASLLEATRKLAAGDPGARTRLPYGHGELSDLARAFDDMAGAIQARQAERDRAEQALRESEERFRAFMNHSPAIAFVKDQAGVYLYANQAFERALGLEADAWFGRTDDELWTEGTAARLRAADRGVLSTGQPRQEVESFELREGGAAHWLSVTFPLTDASGRTLLAGTCLDLSEWRQLQEALGRSERRYRNLVDQAPDGIALTDPARRMIAVNAALATLSGYSPEELQDRRLDDLLVPGSLDSLPGGLDHLPPGVNAWSACAVRRRDGSTLPAEISAKLLEHGAVQAFLRDVSARHAAEAALRASEERFRRLYHYLPIAYQALTLDGVIVEVNEAWVQLMGVPSERAIGARFASLLPASSRARLEESLAALPASESLHNVEFSVARAGRAAAIVSVDGRVGQDERGEPRVHCVLRDVTAARLGATRLAVSEERFRTLFSESPISLWEEDFSGIKRHIERLAGLGVSDLDAHFAAHPEELADCVETVRVVDVNQATLALYGADSRSQMLAGLDRIVGADGYDVFRDGNPGARARRSLLGERRHQLHAVGRAHPPRASLVAGTGGRDLVVPRARLGHGRHRTAPGGSGPAGVGVAPGADVQARAGPHGDQHAPRGPVRRRQRRLRPGTRLPKGGEVIGRSATEIGLWVDPEHRASLVARLDSPRERRKRGGPAAPPVGGAIMDGLCSVVPLVVDGEECLLVHVVDITARKRAEEAERESRRMLTTLMSNLPGMVYQCCDDPEWTMMFVSEGCRELTGYEPHDLIGNRRISYGALILDEDREMVVAEVASGNCRARAASGSVYRIRRAMGRSAGCGNRDARSPARMGKPRSRGSSPARRWETA